MQNVVQSIGLIRELCGIALIIIYYSTNRLNLQAAEAFSARKTRGENAGRHAGSKARRRADAPEKTRRRRTEAGPRLRPG